MKHLLNFKSLTALIVLAAMAAPSWATPCELEMSDWGMYVASEDCLAAKVEIDRDLTKLFMTPRLQLKLPNLFPRKVKFRLYFDEVQVVARTKNLGEAQAKAHDVHVQVDVFSAGSIVGSHQWTARNPTIAADGSFEVGVGTFYRNTNDDLDIQTTFIVDSNSASTGGEVWESNESDNMRVFSQCRIWGSNSVIDHSIEICD